MRSPPIGRDTFPGVGERIANLCLASLDTYLSSPNQSRPLQHPIPSNDGAKVPVRAQGVDEFEPPQSRNGISSRQCIFDR